ncbi:DUF4157 domain-containing protein [Nostoc sp. FACHB-190]|uniref:eCIS core domain-containing protein n=1 Tax=Nostoc sp. FACHB-190 TaxID=2692838 RepID=UPI001684C54C|nr:DUF4157 domain-containing protein [Nostoc sp. FACHB-190]MBD2299766.1 DUF4157 domain-containing protein [Nostoc sp. FACHB-190]
MYTRQYKTKKTSTNSAETSTTNQFAPRRFVVQPDEEITNNQTSDLQAKSGNKRNLPNISVFPSSVTLQPSPIQMKLTIGQPGDKYEQEADRLAADVVQQINAPETQQIQREVAPEEEEVRMKPISGNIQREAAPEEEEVRMKPIVQRLSGAGGMTAKPDLEQSIQQARSSGQPLTESIKEPMEQAFGADFSAVRIHADAQSDELNQSIQAKAFTTGKDIFFRQGEYQPGNRGGQELIAHELTHVVQQSGGTLKISKSYEQAIQRFKDTLNDTSDVTEEDIKNAPKEKLEEWLRREESDSWDDEGNDLVPTPIDKDRIKEAIVAIEKANAEQEKLKELGVTAEQLLLFQNITEEAQIIKKCATTCQNKEWNLTVVLNSLQGYSQEARKTALSVLAKGEVNDTEALTTLASNWNDMQDKSTINIKTLITLIKSKAIVVEGGTYKVPELTGTEDTAYTFYFNAVQRLRINPEWHVHITSSKELKRPGFKNKGDKYNVGPGTRDETKTQDSKELLQVCQQF